MKLESSKVLEPPTDLMGDPGQLSNGIIWLLLKLITTILFFSPAFNFHCHAVGNVMVSNIKDQIVSCAKFTLGAAEDKDGVRP